MRIEQMDVTELPYEVQTKLVCQLASMIVSVIVDQARDEANAMTGLAALYTDMKEDLAMRYPAKGSA